MGRYHESSGNIRELILIIAAIIGLIGSLLGIFWGIMSVWNSLFVDPYAHFHYSVASYTTPNTFAVFLGVLFWFGLCFLLLYVCGKFLGERISDAFSSISQKLK